MALRPNLHILAGETKNSFFCKFQNVVKIKLKVLELQNFHLIKVHFKLCALNALDVTIEE